MRPSSATGVKNWQKCGLNLQPSAISSIPSTTKKRSTEREKGSHKRKRERKEKRDWRSVDRSISNDFLYCSSCLSFSSRLQSYGLSVSGASTRSLFHLVNLSLPVLKPIYLHHVLNAGVTMLERVYQRRVLHEIERDGKEARLGGLVFVINVGTRY